MYLDELIILANRIARKVPLSTKEVLDELNILQVKLLSGYDEDTINKFLKNKDNEDKIIDSIMKNYTRGAIWYGK